MPTVQSTAASFAGTSLQNTYANLPRTLYTPLSPTPVTAPSLLALNTELAKVLGLNIDQLTTEDALAIFAGNAIPEGAIPLAQAYAGHQFGQYNPALGDGRALLLGEVLDTQGTLQDIQLKGSGPTPYSRAGDGRSALGPVLREYLVSESMHALGIKTTRALAAVKTGDTVYRQRPEPGGILTRVAHSHVRIGTFEYVRAQGDKDALKQLADYCITRHYPKAKDNANPYLALLEAVIHAQANLVVSWLTVGFIHGVMNTDNMAISGETIDYGPCAFMDIYHPATVFSSIDHQGRYAYANQGDIAQWNLTRFAECLLTLIDEDTDTAVAMAQGALKTFSIQFNAAWLEGFGSKLGLQSPTKKDETLIQDFLQLMQKNQSDFTTTFRQLSQYSHTDTAQGMALFPNTPKETKTWLNQWHLRLKAQSHTATQVSSAMDQVNPVFIARNFHVEAALSAAINEENYEPYDALLAALKAPYKDQPKNTQYASAPQEPNTQYQTFCGT